MLVQERVPSSHEMSRKGTLPSEYRRVHAKSIRRTAPEDAGRVWVMDAGSTAGITGLIVLVVVNAVFSAAHAALVNARKPQLKELADLGDRRAQRVLDVSEDATRLLTSRQFVGIIL